MPPFLAQKKNQIPVKTNPTPMRPKSAKMALLGIEVGGVTPAAGSTVDRGRMWDWVRLTKVTMLEKGEESGRGAMISACSEECRRVFRLQLTSRKFLTNV